MNPRKRHLGRSPENLHFKRSRSSASTYSSDSESEEQRRPQGFVTKVSDYIKHSILGNFLLKRVADMFSPRPRQRLSSQRPFAESTRENKEVLGRSAKSVGESSSGRNLLSYKKSLDQSTLLPPFSFSSGRPFFKDSHSSVAPDKRLTSSFTSKNGDSDSDVVILPIPVVKSHKSPKKIFKFSGSNLSYNGISNGHRKSPIRKKKVGDRTGTPFRKYEFTAKESIRLAERDKYKQLLQQYTTMPVMSVGASLKSSRSSSSSSVCEILNNAETDKKLNQSQPILIKSKLDKDHSRQLSLRLQSLSNMYQKSKFFANGSRSNDKSPIIIDLEDSSSSSKSQSNTDEVITIRSDSENEEAPKIRHPPILIPRKNILDEKTKQFPFFSREWTQRLKKELEEVSTDLKPLIEIAEIEAETLKKQRDHRGEALRKRLLSQLRESKYTYHEIEELRSEPEKDFVELTDEMEARIEEALIPTPPDQSLVEAFNLTIRRRDIETLAKLNWLNDEVINFYFSLLVDRGKNDNFPSVYAFNTFFYPKLMSNGHPALKRWTRKVDIFSYDFILIPIHLGMHWCLATINFKESEICYYDSLLNRNNDCLKALKLYLCDECLDKKKKPFDASNWTLSTPKDIPQQMNGSDCGMFACIYAEYITREAEITFTQEDMPYFRRRMVYEILTKQLL